VGGDVLLNDSPGAQFQDYEYIKDGEGGRDQDEEVTCHDHLGMVVGEGLPTLFWI